MPLPAENTPWLPREWAPAYDRYRFSEAIWLNDTEVLQSILTGGSTTDTAGRGVAELRKRRGIFVNLMRRWGWAKITPLTEKRVDMPVPIGANLAELSAQQLMSEAPRFRFVERDEKTGRARTAKGKTQDRLDMIANSDDAHMTLLEGGAIASAISGVVLKAAWDTTDPDRESVWFDAVGADCALPEFNAQGRTTAVTLWQEYPAKGDKVFRHLERHAAGVIEHAMFLGTEKGLGKQVKLDHPDGPSSVAELLAIPGVTMGGLTLTINTGITRPTAAFWRNRPTLAWRRRGFMANLGRSDFELVEPLLDSYSEAWASMMRDVRLGKARLLVPLGMLERSDSATPGSGATFDPDREIYKEVGGLNPDAGTNTIKDYQAEIRYQEHLGVLAGIKLEILDAAGWSLSSYGQPAGEQGQGAVTATEVVDRTTKSERTRDAKALMFKQPANGFIRMLMELDELLYPGKGGSDELPELQIDFPDVSQVDPEKQARMFLDLSTAHGISIEQTVREKHPNWDDDDIDLEVGRIREDMNALTANLPDPTKIDLTDPNQPDPPKPDDAEDKTLPR